MPLRLFIFVILACLGGGAVAQGAQYEESVCALATADFSSDSDMQIKIISNVSSVAGYASVATLTRNENEITIGKSVRTNIFSLDKAPTEHNIRIDGVNAKINFERQATISQGNGIVKIRQAILSVANKKNKTLLCFYSSY